jgi:hypothetical protein
MACSKEKKALKNIEGTWNVTAMTEDSAGTVTDMWAVITAMGITSMKYQFGAGEATTGGTAYMISAGTVFGFPVNETDTVTYSISSDGTTLSITDDGETTIGTIDKLTSSALELSETDSLGVINKMTLAKE